MVTAECPSCGCLKVWKDGLRRTAQKGIQRYLCKDCGYRFSKWNGQTSYNRSSEAFVVKSAPQQRTKNLTSVERHVDGSAGVTIGTEDNVKGKVVEFAWNLKKQGYKPSTIEVWTGILRRLAERADLLDPESVLRAIATKDCSDNFKATISIAYSAFTRMFGLPWKPPRYRITQKLPFIPTEKELDALIAACGKKMSTFLKTLKETGMRSGEACKLRWIDVDSKNSAITVNNPEKNSNPRIIKVSRDLIAMLHALPKNSETVFNTTRSAMQSNLTYQRKTVARKNASHPLSHL
jgi:integrase